MQLAIVQTIFPDILECFVRIEGEVLQPRGWEVGGHKQSVNIPAPVRVGARARSSELGALPAAPRPIFRPGPGAPAQPPF